MSDDQDIVALLGRVSKRLDELHEMIRTQRTVKDWYAIDEFAALVGKAEFTCREWARLGRIHAEKRRSGRGKHAAWVISHDELQRYRREGLLPLEH
ncbi:hypothetical protein BH23PLA1_BH23PLA1_39740 [soil metagenome]